LAGSAARPDGEEAARMQHDTAFQVSASNLRFGRGITREIGMDLRDLGAARVMLVIDPALVRTEVGEKVVASLRASGIGYEVFDAVSIEPTDASFRMAADFAARGRFDAYVAVGGGSTIDTAKAANLYATHPADFLDYVNAPIGRGLPVPAPLRPLVAVPTTAGTGSETTGVAIFDYREKRAKTGIAHRYLRPTLGIVDSDNTRTQPSAVAASAGLDVLSHALESYTALPYDRRPMPARPLERPAYQGSNPVSDVWALRALELIAEFLPRAVADPSDDEARSQMLLASSMAGIGFGNAGVHLPHGMSYPVAGMVRSYRPAGYMVDHPLVPHGISVILNTPAVVRFTCEADPARHLRAAVALGADVRDAAPSEAGEVLRERVVHFMKLLGVPNGLAAIGYNEGDIPALVEGTLPQHRVTKLSPRPAGPEELAGLFRDSMRIWEEPAPRGAARPRAAEVS
jgi:hydroxyacid-oxoacid transhydrogenase